MRELREREIFWAIPIRFRLKQGGAGTLCPKFSLPETRPAQGWKKSSPFLQKNQIRADQGRSGHIKRDQHKVMTLMTLQFMKSHGWRTTPKQELN
jgi:hypothetical protein